MNSKKRGSIWTSISDGFRRFRAAYKIDKDNVLFEKENLRLKIPPVEMIWDTIGSASFEDYYRSGIEDAEMIYSLIKKHYKGERKLLLDFGCGPGRVFRHLPEVSDITEANIRASDINREYVTWCKNHLPAVRTISNESAPPLNFDDDFFTIALALDVFTRMNENSIMKWLSELDRLLHSKGILITSFFSDEYAADVLPRDVLRKHSKGQSVQSGEGSEGSRMRRTFIPQKTLTRIFEKQFTILEKSTDPRASIRQGQEIWIMIQKS